MRLLPICLIVPAQIALGYNIPQGMVYMEIPILITNTGITSSPKNLWDHNNNNNNHNYNNNNNNLKNNTNKKSTKGKRKTYEAHLASTSNCHSSGKEKKNNKKNNTEF